MNSLAAAVLTLLTIIIFIAPRRYAILAFMAGLLYITQANNAIVLGFNIYPGRILELSAFTRVIVRGEFSFRNLNNIDRAFLMLYVYNTIVYLVRATEPAAYQIALAVDASLCFFALRGLIATLDDFQWFLCFFVIFLMPYAILVLIERHTGFNIFSNSGGIVEYALYIRDDKPRCWGSFRHPILLGTFGASFLPLYIGLGCRLNRICGAIGALLCLCIVYASNSGGPLSAALSAVLGWLLWNARTRMQLVRRTILAMVAMLAIIMKAPIWYIFARISSVTGGEGYHRSYLMDIAFSNFGKWWLAGMRLADTHEWFPYTSPTLEGADMTNLYLSFGINAGLFSIFLFIFFLTRTFSDLGRSLEATRKFPGESSAAEYMLWGFGVMVTTHIISWFGVCYFDQLNLMWFVQAAAISSISADILKRPELVNEIS